MSRRGHETRHVLWLRSPRASSSARNRAVPCSDKDNGMTPECDIGARFRAAGRTMFGRESEIWEVVSTFQAIDGLRYAQLVHVHDRTRTKTIAAAGLLDE